MANHYQNQVDLEFRFLREHLILSAACKPIRDAIEKSGKNGKPLEF